MGRPALPLSVRILEARSDYGKSSLSLLGEVVDGPTDQHGRRITVNFDASAIATVLNAIADRVIDDEWHKILADIPKPKMKAKHG